MSASINWALLETQYFSDKIYKNDLAKMVKIVDHDVNITSDLALLYSQDFTCLRKIVLFSSKKSCRRTPSWLASISLSIIPQA